MKKCPKCGKSFENAPTLCPNDGAVLVKPGDGLVGQTLAGKYRIEERISEGGMGTVYRATHVLMEKAVAIKVLHPSLAADDKIVARFTREAKAASRISNPHALNVTDFGESENGIVFLVMEYLRGKTLKEVIRSEGPLPLARVVEVTKQICGALDAAHAEGVVHRDLKSDNIMLEEVAGGNDWAKVLDFGIAKIQEPVGQDPELTAPNLIIGTPQYMSPEQCSQASDIDARSDIYSLGIILFEMLAGHVPFTGDSATAIMLKHLQEQPPSLLDERKDVPPAVAAVVARALSKLPDERQESAGELAEALATAAADSSAAVAGGMGTSENARPGMGDTNRIVVPTAPLETRATTSNEVDEATVVQARQHAYVEDEPELFEMPPPAAAFNPWRIMIPAAVLLIALLGVFFAYQRNSNSTPANDNSQPLTADPNASPVQPGASPTGAAENNIVPVNSTPTPAASGGSGQTSTGGDGTPVNPNPTPQATPSATPTPDEEGNSNTPQEDEEDEPTPTPTPRRNPTPPPARTPTPTPDADPPPPKATPPALSAPNSDPPPGDNLPKVGDN
ncbi:MAG TPA: protein kinase [Pyrinomonadaceae bacterium]|nr:protein kinase [Pyrinomonadaceae bacterium]